MEQKTWPAMTVELMHQESVLLQEKAKRVALNPLSGNKKMEMLITGIRCPMTVERSAKMLLRTLDQEQEELIGLCNTYNKLSLEREAILKTSLFRKIVRRVDVANDLFFFETFSHGLIAEVFGDVQALENSTVTSGLSRLIEEINGYDVPSDFNKHTIEKRLRLIISEAKNLLWRRRSDVGLMYQKRIPIQLLDPPHQTKERIVQWKENGYAPKIIAHRDSFTVTLPDFCVSALRNCLVCKIEEWGKTFSYEIADKLDQPDEYRSREFNLDSIYFATMELMNIMQPNPLHRDPIIYLEKGDWTIVIDQYADFPKEKDIIRAVKDHYKILGTQHGISEFVN